MEGYIRKRTDFSAVLLNILSYDVVLHSIFDATSTIVAAYRSDVAQGDFVICGEYNGVVKQVAVTGRTMTLTCADIDSIFDRPLYFAPDTDTNQYNIEGFIRVIITLFFRHSDSMYDMDYIGFSSTNNTTPFFMPNLTDKNMYTLSSYIKAARRRGVNVQYDLTGEKLNMDFARTPTTLYKLDFAVNNTVTSETYGGYSVAKITNYVDGCASNYYLLSDGTVTQNSNDSRRVYGAWEVMNDATEEAILQKFAVSYGHEIEFSSEKKLALLTPLQLKMPSGRLVTSFVSSIKRKSGANKYNYTAGELQTTLTAKLRR